MILLSLAAVSDILTLSSCCYLSWTKSKMGLLKGSSLFSWMLQLRAQTFDLCRRGTWKLGMFLFPFKIRTAKTHLTGWQAPQLFLSRGVSYISFILLTNWSHSLGRKIKMAEVPVIATADTSPPSPSSPIFWKICSQPSHTWELSPRMD